MGLIVFRCDAGEKIGGGHLSRCLSLANNFCNHNINFLIKTSEDLGPDIISDYSYSTLSSTIDFYSELKIIEDRYKEKADVLILDVSNPLTYENISQFTDYLKDLRKYFKNIALIDGMKNDSIISKVKNLYVDYYITPYVGVEDFPDYSFNHLSGPKYFSLSGHFSFPAQKKNISPLAQQILITMGQADPFQVTIAALKVITSKDIINSLPSLKVRIVVGAFFSEDLKFKIDTFKNEFSFIEIIENETNLEPHFKWCDLAFSTTGLTKYELAYFGVPTAFISFNQQTEELHKPYNDLLSSLYLGIVNHFDEKTSASHILDLIKDVRKRSAFSEKSQKLVDGKGGQRIIKEILT